MNYNIAQASKTDFYQIQKNVVEFWGSDHVLEIHHPMFIHEFGDTAFVIKDGDLVLAYLFGFIAQTSLTACVHLVGVRKDQRGKGLGKRLYLHFLECAKAKGCHKVKAITTPRNTLSIIFHKKIGMTLLGVKNENGIEVVKDYSGIGQDRVVFEMPI